MSKEKKVKASDYKCCVCGKQAEVFYPVIDPDIPPHPYCRKCAEKANRELLIKLLGQDFSSDN